MTRDYDKPRRGVPLIIVVFAIAVLTVAVCAGYYAYRGIVTDMPKQNSDAASAEQEQLVESYISETYGLDCRVIGSKHVLNSEGFTGGLHMYWFTCRYAPDFVFTAEYRSYEDLSSETIGQLEFPDLDLGDKS